MIEAKVSSPGLGSVVADFIRTRVRGTLRNQRPSRLEKRLNESITPTTPDPGTADIRVHELATELGVDSKTVLTALRQIGEFTKSASSTVGYSVAKRVRDHIRAKPGTQEPAPGRPPARQAPPPLASSRPIAPQPARPHRLARGNSSPPSDMAKVFLRRAETEEQRDPWSRPRPRHVLVQAAEVNAREWAKHWFTPQEVETWLDVHPGLPAHVASALREAGLTPRQAAIRVTTPRGFTHRLPIAIRVSTGELTANEAAEELRASGQM